MTLNCVKLGRAITFMKHFGSAVSLIFLPETSIWNKTTFPASNSLNFAELVVYAPMKSIYKKNVPIFLFVFCLSLLNIKISRAYN